VQEEFARRSRFRNLADRISLSKVENEYVGKGKEDNIIKWEVECLKPKEGGSKDFVFLRKGGIFLLCSFLCFRIHHFELIIFPSSWLTILLVHF
jgi:hypothetical protein